MAAIITDQIRILNAKNFLAGVSNASNSYYSFIGLTNPADYQVDAVVKQFKRLPSDPNARSGDGLETAKKYKFYGIFPTNIAAIDLSYDTSDTIEEFTVEFQVQYWSPDNSAD